MKFNKNLKKFRLVTFDITDTLLKFRQDPIKIYVQTAAQFGYDGMSEKELGVCFRQEFTQMDKSYPNFGCKNLTWERWWLTLVKRTFYCAKPNIDETNLHELAKHLLKIFRTKECWKRVECVENLVGKVRECGITVGCISNSDPSLRMVLDEMNILHHFDFILTSYDVNVPKPEKQIFDIALTQGGNIDACEALHIGNSLELDFMGAQNAGWSSLLVTDNATKLTDLKEDFVYENICDMLKALETKNIKW